MPTLADLLNSPGEIEFEGKAYKLRQPTLIECGLYQRWLEESARAAAGRATELPEADRRRLLRDVTADIAAGDYAYGGEVCIRSLQTPRGMSKLLSIVCADQGLDEGTARRMVDEKLLEIAQLLLGAAEEEAGGKASPQLRTLLSKLGLPANFLQTSSSASATTPPAGPPTSNDSAA